MKGLTHGIAVECRDLNEIPANKEGKCVLARTIAIHLIHPDSLSKKGTQQDITGNPSMQGPDNKGHGARRRKCAPKTENKVERRTNSGKQTKDDT